MGIVWRRLAAVAALSTTGRPTIIKRMTTSFMVESTAAAASSLPVGDGTHRQSNENGTCRVDVTSFPRLQIHHFLEPVGSTQDEARRLLNDVKPQPHGPFPIIIANQQTNGRGTKGRKWESGPQVGNLYMTACIPYESLPVIPTLLPLQIAVLVAEEANRTLLECRENQNGKFDDIQVKVKWPNDVLINEDKLAGILIESETVEYNTWLLVGIGTNIAFAPNLDQSPGKSTRGSTCIQEHCHQPSINKVERDSVGNATKLSNWNSSDAKSNGSYEFGVSIAKRLADWVLDTSSTTKEFREKKVIDQWKSFAEFGNTYEVRGTVEEENEGNYNGEQVVLLDIQRDGQLLVRGKDGRDRLLVADYLF